MMHVAVAFHDAQGLYGLFAAATIRSVLARTASRLNIHVVHDATFSDRSRALLVDVAAAYGQCIRFHTVPSTLPRPGNIPDAYGPGSFYRYLLPDLPDLADVSRILYLDCDMCAMLDIAELWQAARFAMDEPGGPDGPVMALVRSVTARDQRARLEKLGIDARRYGNSGMIVMDLERMRSRIPRLFQTMVGSLGRLPQDLPYPDQDALGVLCRRLPVCWLDERFNYQIHVDNRWNFSPSELEGKLIHYCGRKPWCAPGYPAGEIFMAHLRALEKHAD